VALNLQLFPTNGKQGPATLANNEQEKVDQIEADKISSGVGFALTRRNVKKISKAGAY
jgi:hypothetical protein